jgi:hydrogenase expression/formation protein HypC
MCLAIPMEVESIAGEEAIVKQAGLRRNVRLDLLDEVEPGDYVLIHAGFAIEKVRPEEAEETLALLREMAGAIP